MSTVVDRNPAQSKKPGPMFFTTLHEMYDEHRQKGGPGKSRFNFPRPEQINAYKEVYRGPAGIKLRLSDIAGLNLLIVDAVESQSKFNNGNSYYTIMFFIVNEDKGEIDTTPCFTTTGSGVIRECLESPDNKTPFVARIVSCTGASGSSYYRLVSTTLSPKMITELVDKVVEAMDEEELDAIEE